MWKKNQMKTMTNMPIMMMKINKKLIKQKKNQIILKINKLIIILNKIATNKKINWTLLMNYWK